MQMGTSASTQLTLQDVDHEADAWEHGENEEILKGPGGVLTPDAKIWAVDRTREGSGDFKIDCFEAPFLQEFAENQWIQPSTWVLVN
jgi:hypothetical protein